MAKQIWKSGYMSNVKDEFIILETIYNNKKKYLIVNRRGDFKTSHTHVKSLKVAKEMVHLVAKKITPESKSIFFIESLMRINKDKKYAITLTLYMNKLKEDKSN